MRSPIRNPGSAIRTRRGSAVAIGLAVCAPFAACSLLAPSDRHFLGTGAEVSHHGGQAAGEGGASEAGVGGQGGVGAEGGAAGGAKDENQAGEATGGQAGAGGAGGEAPSSGCVGDFRDVGGKCVSISGCSDGTREGFAPASTWPNIAGCTATWPRSSLRAPKTGASCGFERGACPAPADACGEGWHVCALPPFGPTEVSAQLTAEQCAAQSGAYVAAVGDQHCEPCSDAGDGAACCGASCVQQNGSCIFPGMTAWFGVVNNYKNVCGAIESELAEHGVLCCGDH